MWRALPGSALVHVAVLGAALIGFSWPEAEDAPAAEAVSVSIVTMSSVSSNATEIIQSDSTANLVSSGSVSTSATVIEPVETETVEPIAETLAALEPEVQEPLSEPVVEPIETEAPVAAEAPVPIEPVSDIAMLTLTAVSPLVSQPIAASQPETIDPVSSEQIELAPVPQTLARPRTSTPTYPKAEPQQQPAPRKVASPPPSVAGNGGANNADATASAGSAAQQVGSGNGGDAKVAKYPSEVLRKLRRALRSNSGPRGEVLVRFTVHADGQVSGVSVGRSSGNDAVDQAGLATVMRAAPFAPIPPAANRSTWTFDIPLAFGG